MEERSFIKRMTEGACFVAFLVICVAAILLVITLPLQSQYHSKKQYARIDNLYYKVKECKTSEDTQNKSCMLIIDEGWGKYKAVQVKDYWEFKNYVFISDNKKGVSNECKNKDAILKCSYNEEWIKVDEYQESDNVSFKDYLTYTKDK